MRTRRVYLSTDDRQRRDVEPSTLDRPRIVDDMRGGFER
ncbi:putative membrane-bound spermidine synthase [Prescottella agglutinans]|uniref:Membrane-bound spermidine synthase n=1 Tax=Prescottella agglutinans TaxID=1644129 RepID=A0ABT6M716_9NOCA|nr:putative membrane-bound spermidine synthase [Prescottella agglutinans]